MPKIIEMPNPENTLIGNEKFVKKLYAKPSNIHTMFDVSRTTIYNWLSDYNKLGGSINVF